MSVGTMRCPFVRERVRVYRYAVRVRYAGNVVGHDDVWAKDVPEAIRKADYIKAAVAREAMDNSWIDAGSVTFDLLDHGGREVFIWSVANSATTKE